MIYLAQAEGTDIFKIGYTSKRSPDQRIKSLQSSCPYTLNVFDCFPGSNQLEKKIHTFYESKKLKGEWFRLAASDLQKINQFKPKDRALPAGLKSKSKMWKKSKRLIKAWLNTDTHELFSGRSHIRSEVKSSLLSCDIDDQKWRPLFYQLIYHVSSEEIIYSLEGRFHEYMRGLFSKIKWIEM